MNEFLLYIRVLDLVTTHYNVVKIGVTDCKIERESTYKTGEYIPGHFSHLYKINYNGKREHFDEKLKKLIKEYNRIGFNEFDVEGGKEFYDIELIEKLEEYLKKITKYKLLDQDEIDEINRRSRSNVERDNDTESESESESETDSGNESDSESESDSGSDSESESESGSNYYNDSIKPLQHQQDVLNKIKDYYENNDIGKLIWACGLGKSLMTTALNITSTSAGDLKFVASSSDDSFTFDKTENLGFLLTELIINEGLTSSSKFVIIFLPSKISFHCCFIEFFYI